MVRWLLITLSFMVYAMQSYGVVDYTPETAVESEKRFL